LASTYLGVKNLLLGMFKKIKNTILDILFPKKCFGCGKADIYLCQNCFEKIKITPHNFCPVCKRPIPDSLICIKCQKKINLNRLIWSVPYSNILVQTLIKKLKYDYVKELANPLSQLLINSLSLCVRFNLTHNDHHSSLNTQYLFVPVPLHKRKLRERDFNQAELLAERVAKHFSIPLENALVRKKYTLPQAKTKNHEIRKKSLKNAFEISKEFTKKCIDKNKNILKDKIVILVDDVFTTGTTMSEAAKVLRQAGAKEIWGLVIAKG